MDLKEFEERVEELENRQKQIRKTSKAILDSFALHLKNMEKKGTKNIMKLKKFEKKLRKLAKKSGLEVVGVRTSKYDKRTMLDVNFRLEKD